eukprot:1575657-Rhodomonas_salina.2
MCGWRRSEEAREGQGSGAIRATVPVTRGCKLSRATQTWTQAEPLSKPVTPRFDLSLMRLESGKLPPSPV